MSVVIQQQYMHDVLLPYCCSCSAVLLLQQHIVVELVCMHTHVHTYMYSNAVVASLLCTGITTC